MSKEEDEVVEDRGDLVEPVEDVDDEVEDLDELEDDDEEEVEDVDDSDTDDDPDSDDEDDEEDEVEDDEEEDEDDEDDEDPKDQMVPRSRIDQLVAQREEERERNQWLQEQLEAMIQRTTEVEEEVEEEPARPEYDFHAAELKYGEAMLEGEPDKAAKIRGEINKAHAAEYAYQIEAAKRAAKAEAVSETTNSIDERRFNSLLATYTQEYDFLNDESDSYNAKAVTMANKLMAGYMQEGKMKSEALKLAVEDVTPFFEQPKADKKETKSTARKKQARKKAAKASKAQPPNTGGKKGKAARNLDTIDMSKISEKDFNNLTAREKAKLRGDVL